MEARATLERGKGAAARADGRAHAAAREARPWLEPLGRLGYAANGVVYTLVGVLAVQAAMGDGGNTTDTHGALPHILQAPFGHFMLGIVAVGLAGYALWRFLQAALDVEGRGTGPKGLVVRAGYGVTGTIYLALAASAAGLVLGSGSAGGGDAETQDRTAWLMQQPFGSTLVVAVGLVVIGVALSQFWRASTAEFQQHLRLSEMSLAERRWAKRLGRFGFAARGVLLLVVGGFLALAGVQARPDQARGLGGALATLASQPYGPWLLGAVALGLVAYAAFLFVEARYRDIPIQ